MNFKTTFEGKPFSADSLGYTEPIMIISKKVEDGKKQTINFNKAALNLLGYKIYKEGTKISLALGDDDEWYAVKSNLGGDVACTLYQDGTVKNANMVKQMWAYMGLDESVDNIFMLELCKDTTDVYAKLIKL